MITVRTKTLILIACIAECFLILGAQFIGNTMLLLPVIGLFVALIAWAAIKGMAVPALLFFMPFASIIKLQPGTVSFFTIALLAVYLIYFVKGIRNVYVYHFVPGLCLIGLALAIKTLNGYSIDNSFILFAASILLVPFLIREFNVQYDLYWLTVFFALGIIIAAITAKYLLIFPSFSKFVGNVISFGVVRRSGYYGDPNFYSAHITAALSGALVLLLNNNRRKRVVIIILLSIVLVYCGFMSVSKSFILVTMALFLVWLIEFMFIKGRVSTKLMIIFTFLIAAAFLLSTTVFTDLIGMVLTRFKGASNISDFTTGRTEIWLNYIEAFIDKPLLLLFGKGFTSLLIFEKATHSTIIQAVYQFGLVGCVFFVGWFFCYFRMFLQRTKPVMSDIAQMFILLLGIFGPWVALDVLFFDELFLMPIYMCVGISFIEQSRIIKGRIE